MTSTADSAPRGAEKVAGTGGSNPAPALPPDHTPTRCAECVRLGQQLTAASLAGDRSRMVDVRVMQERHRTVLRGQAGAA